MTERNFKIALHPDDRHRLLNIRRFLVGARVVSGLNVVEASQRMNGTKTAVKFMEAADEWRIRLSRLQEWPRVFDMKLHLQLSFPVADPYFEFMEAAEVKPLGNLIHLGDGYHRQYLVACLRAERVLQGVTQSELGRRLGIKGGAVYFWEENADEVMLPRLLAHTRALGGLLELGILDERGDRVV